MSEYSLWKFYIVLQNWINLGMPRENAYYFEDDEGLCVNLQNYLTHAPKESSMDIRRELNISFVQADLCYRYPFNNSAYEYNQEASLKNTYVTNKQRLDWIKEQSEIGN